MKAILIGIGKMGSVWAEEIENCDGIQLESIVDIDKRKKKIAENKGLRWYDGISDIPEDSDFDIWFITTPVENHFEYMEKAIELGAETIFVEKPSTSNPENSKHILELSRKNDVKVAVDYIERRNPVVRRIVSDIKNEEDFTPNELIHWRGKTSDSVVPFMRDDFCHDISEIELLLSQADKEFSNLDVTEVNDVRTWNESERDEDALFDVGATLVMEGEGIKAKIKGAFDEPETRRYFLWINRTQDKAYFGNTVTRSHITPVAMGITGESNIKTAKSMCLDGYPINDDKIGQFADRTDANILEIDELQSSDTIISELSQGDISPCSLEKSYKIEKKIKRAYQMTNLDDI